MKSPVVKRSIVIASHKTSVSLEDPFWDGLKEIAGGRDPLRSSADGANQLSAAWQTGLGQVFEVVRERRRLDRNELERLPATGARNDHQGWFG